MRVVLFDIDGTLVHTAGAGRAALDSAFLALFNSPRRHEVEVNGRTDRGIASSLFAAHSIPDSEENWDRFRRAYLEFLPLHLRQRRGRILPGVCLLLDRLAELSDVATGLLTGNVRRGAQVKLAHFGIQQHFAFGGFGDDCGDRDQVARQALAAVQQSVHHSIAPADIWVVGDTPLDIRCARAIGAQVAAVATGAFGLEQLQAEQPDLMLQDLSSPQALLSQI